MKRINYLSVALLVSLIHLPITTSAQTTQAIHAEIAREQKTLDEFAYSLALQAADWGLPIVVMYNLRYNDALKSDAKSKPNGIWRLEDITTPELAQKAGYVTPNVDVIYGFGFLDLSQEPIILTAPDSHGRYYMVQFVDMYTNSFAYVGGRATGYQGGKFAIVGPGWQGTLPADVTRIDAPTRWILIQPRVHVVDEADLPQAKKVLNEITVQGLSEYTGKAALPSLTYNYIKPEFINPALSASELDFKDPLQFWAILSAAINENPPPKDQITALLPMFKLLGIEIGKTWDPSKVSPGVLVAMKRAAQKIGDMNASLPPVGPFVNGWFLPPVDIGNPQNDYYLRAIIARIGLTANIPKEAVYFMAKVDVKRNVLQGAKKYTAHFSTLPPFIKPGFWSITLYDAKSNYTVANSINRYVISSDSKDLKFNSDGSLTLYLQNTSPGKDKESNWLPSGSGEFYLILRAYAPGSAMIEALTNPSAYMPPTVEEVQ